MEVWFALPVADVKMAINHFPAWKKMGYKIAILTDEYTVSQHKIKPRTLDICGLIDFSHHVEKYEGWPKSANLLCSLLPQADIVITGGADMTPDPKKDAQTIAQEFLDHFGPDLFGIMQPTGDRWMEDTKGFAASERICGSPWIGKGVIQRLNQGNGPLWSEYYHFYADEEMKVVAETLGILWQRRDLTHFHDHWQRNHAVRPEYLTRAKMQWKHDKNIFRKRQRAKFPGSEPLVVKGDE